MNEAIVIDDLEAARGSRRILKGVSVSLKKGSITGLSGPSDSGKSTLIRSIAGAQKVESGTVMVLGRPAGSFVARASLSYTTQASAAYRDPTVRESVAHWTQTTRVPASTADEMTSQFRLTDRAHTLAAGISSGQASRLSLAYTMVDNPPVLLLGEPAVGLDPVLREEIRGLIHKRAAAGTAALVSSHAMDKAQRYNSLAFTHEGSILATGTADDILEETATSSIDTTFLALAEGQAE